MKKVGFMITFKPFTTFIIIKYRRQTTLFSNGEKPTKLPHVSLKVRVGMGSLIQLQNSLIH